MDWETEWPYIMVCVISLLIVFTLIALPFFAPCVLNHTWLSGYTFCPSCGRQVVAVCPVCQDKCVGDFCSDCGTSVLRPSNGS